MIFLNHLKPGDYKYLQVIDDSWPFQFLSAYSRFSLNYHLENISIVYDQELQAFMPLRFMNIKIFSPAQILFAPMRNATELDAEEQLIFFDRLIESLYNKGGCERLVQPHPYSILSAIPAGSKYCEFGTYIVDLENQSMDEIFQKFHPKYQKAVTHSQRNGAVVKTGRNVMSDFYEIYKSTMEKANISYDEMSFFQNRFALIRLMKNWPAKNS